MHRILEVETANNVNISELIDIVKRENLKILYLDNKRDYDENKMLIKFTIRLHYKGVTDKLSHIIVKDLEKSEIPIYKINWLHK